MSALRASGRGGNRCGGSGRVFQSRFWTRCTSSKGSFTGGESQGEWRGGVCGKIKGIRDSILNIRKSTLWLLLIIKHLEYFN